jgi:hypothetical protein
MRFMPNTVGAERKKVFWLIGLVAVALVAYYWSSHSYDTPSAPAASTPTAPTGSAIPPLPTLRREAPPVPIQRVVSRGSARPTDDFKPSLKPKEGVDISSIDPTLHLDRLAKLHNLAMEGGVRSVFKEGSPPPPPAPPPVPIPVGPMQAPKPPTPTDTTANTPPPPPPPTPIPLKFYGFTNAAKNGGPRRAFFLESDGNTFHIAAENELVQNRYKIVRIGVNSAVVEDTKDKHQQTLPLVEELSSS